MRISPQAKIAFMNPMGFFQGASISPPRSSEATCLEGEHTNPQPPWHQDPAHRKRQWQMGKTGTGNSIPWRRSSSGTEQPPPLCGRGGHFSRPVQVPPHRQVLVPLLVGLFARLCCVTGRGYWHHRQHRPHGPYNQTRRWSGEEV